MSRLQKWRGGAEAWQLLTEQVDTDTFIIGGKIRVDDSEIPEKILLNNMKIGSVDLLYLIIYTNNIRIIIRLDSI